jgi:hypothetical protein
MPGDKVAACSYLDLCKRAQMVQAAASQPGSGIVAVAMPRAPLASPVVISTRGGTLFWEPSTDRVMRVKGIEYGASLAFADDDREVWLLENGRRLFKVAIDDKYPRAELIFELRGSEASGADEIMLAAPPVISPCGRMVLAEFVCQVPRAAAEQEALDHAMARNHTGMSHEKTHWSLHKRHVILDSDQYAYCDVTSWKIPDLTRCVWLADPAPKRL